ncbi:MULTISPECIES: hypothetical protein [Rhodococcus]|jgi:hypothetical protein|uniref:hypothetical protein n=1 Tax=Nocardiaceae TaxID=85025 RepID=UPI00070F8D54|nr:MULTISPECIES: hypothetical protein [Rhodococcus]KQU35765.1 hypothetical protein ASH04_24130 [Rhodococcus sp. Leaf233]MBP2527403.1 hypothetical protein [Rhodococcus sp. PvP104]WQH31129.1 hypothetical protein U2G91_26585 [Rhodococcus fascians]
MNKFTRRIAAVGVTVAATGAAIVGSVIAAPAASAAVPSGDYTFTTTAFGIPSTSPARVDGDKLTLFSPIGPITHTIKDLPVGGFIDDGFQRLYIGGETFFGPFVIGNNTLTPR